MMRSWTFAVCALMVFACSSDVTESATTPILAVQQEMRIGSVDDRDYVLTYVGKIEVGQDGTMYVQQPMQQTIKVYDSAGTYVRRIGRMGGGPGEFMSMFFMGWVGDTLWVYDGASSRISQFNQAGEFINSLRFPGPGQALLLGDGSLLLSPQVKRPAKKPLLRFQPGSGQTDTIATVVPPPQAMRVTEGPVRYSTAWHPFNDESLWAVSPDGSFIIIVDRMARSASDSAWYSVTRLSSLADTTWCREYQYRPRAITEDVITAVVGPAVEQQNAQRSTRGRPQVSLAAVSAALYRPDALPPVTGLIIGNDHSIWLRQEDPGDSLVSWNVLDGDGGLVGVLELPRTTMIRRATLVRIWAVEHDEFDVPYVTRYRISTGDRELM